MADLLRTEIAPRVLTPARVALGRTGASIRTRDHLAFELDHAFARDAVGAQMNTVSLVDELHRRGWRALMLHSAASVAGREGSRRTYLQRPDLGRQLCAASAEAAREAGVECAEAPDVVFVLADGLSALAVERHALPLLDAAQKLLPEARWRVGPVCVVRDGRVAVADEIGELLGAAMTVILIGERPGLSAPDSLGAYITWAPKVGRTDAERNCISNIRVGGLGYDAAAESLVSYLVRAREFGKTGVELKGSAAGPVFLRAGSGA